MTKELEDFKFIFHGTCDVSEISKHLSKYHVEWFKNTFRQDEYHMHRDTKSIFIYDYPVSWSPGEKYLVEHSSEDNDLFQMVLPIIESLEKLHNGKVGKAVFINLPPFKNVDKHKDAGGYLESVRRHHIPIATNERVSFVIDGERKFMRVGEIWEVNNNKVHQVWNEGDTDRVHLLIDIIPNNVIGENDV
jgi:hypothetical protein